MNTSKLKAPIGLAALGLLLIALIALQVLSTPAKRAPISNEMRLSEWLHGRNRAAFDLTRSDTVQLIQGFGPEAIPLLIKAHRSAASLPPKSGRSIFGRKGPQLTPAQMKLRALTGLVVLSHDYPEDVDPFIRGLLSTTDRAQTIPFLGFLGPRYFDALTNIIATGSVRDMQLAVEQLNRMNAKAPDGIPVVVDRVMTEWNGGSSSLDPLRLLDDLRPLPPDTIKLFLKGMGSTNSWVRHGCVRALSRIPHAKPLAADVLRNMAQTNRPGTPAASFAILNLNGFGVRGDEILPLALANLEALLGAKVGYSELSQIKTTAIALLNVHDPEATSLIREKVIPFLRRSADPAHNPDPMHLELSELSLKQVEELLRKLSRFRRP